MAISTVFFVDRCLRFLGIGCYKVGFDEVEERNFIDDWDGAELARQIAQLIVVLGAVIEIIQAEQLRAARAVLLGEPDLAGSCRAARHREW